MTDHTSGTRRQNNQNVYVYVGRMYLFPWQPGGHHVDLDRTLGGWLGLTASAYFNYIFIT